jgi:hypothetical protein
MKCRVEIDLARFEQADAVEFTVCPRLGDTVMLTSRDGKPARQAFTVYRIVHWPGEADAAPSVVVHVR